MDYIGDLVGGFKIGQKLIHQPDTAKLIDRLIVQDIPVFLDAKIFDIPETVYQGIKSLAELGVSYTTVYGDRTIADAAARAARGTQLKVLMVTVLTSWTQENLVDMGIGESVQDLVITRAAMASRYGCHGIICSAQDNPNHVRSTIGNPSLIVATPGIRSGHDQLDDQARVSTARQALDRGSDMIIVGRPIWQSVDPVLAVQKLLQEIS